MAKHEDESKEEAALRKAIKKDMDKIPVKPGGLKKIQQAIKDKKKGK